MDRLVIIVSYSHPAFSVIVKTYCETDGSFAALVLMVRRHRWDEKVWRWRASTDTTDLVQLWEAATSSRGGWSFTGLQ